MESLRSIRRKIRVVKNIQQITQAMKMVAAAKLRKAQARRNAARPYAEKMQELMGYVAPYARDVEHPLLEVRPTQRIGLVVVTGDKGLCGSYNSNLIRRAQAFVADQSCPVDLVTIGRKGTDFFQKRDYSVAASFGQIGVDSSFADLKPVASAVTGLFLNKTVDEIHVAFTESLTTMQQRPRLVKFLPIEPQPQQEAAEQIRRERQPTECFFEPEVPKLLAALLPRYVDTLLYHWLLESLTSELGARMTSMSAASDNAGEMIDSLTLSYNQARQAAITKELLEVMAGAEALKAG